MKERILEIWLDYAESGKEIDEKFISYIISEVVLEKKLQNYFSKLVFLNKNTSENILGYYNPFTGEIKVCLEKILEKSFKHYNNAINNLFFNHLEQQLYLSTLIIGIIMHELEHVKHLKIYDEKVEDLESQLIRLCYQYVEIRKISHSLPHRYMNLNYYKMKNYYKSKVNFYHSSRTFAPHERLAQLYSLKELLHILTLIEKDIPNLIEYLKAAYNAECLKNYTYSSSIVDSPTIKYVNLITKHPKMMYFDEKVLKQFPFFTTNPNESLKKSIENYDFEERLLCGLPITQQEYISLHVSRSSSLARILK